MSKQSRTAALVVLAALLAAGVAAYAKEARLRTELEHLRDRHGPD